MGKKSKRVPVPIKTQNMITKVTNVSSYFILRLYGTLQFSKKLTKSLHLSAHEFIYILLYLKYVL